jgi:hypothetical protein
VHKANKLTKIGLPARNLKRQGSKQTSSFAHISILGVWLLISVEPANPRAIEASSHKFAQASSFHGDSHVCQHSYNKDRPTRCDRSDRGVGRAFAIFARTALVRIIIAKAGFVVGVGRGKGTLHFRGKS